MDRESQFLELIGQVYDAALDEKLFTSLSHEIAQTFGGNSCVIQVQNRAIGFVDRISQTDNYTPESADAYRRHYYKHDVWITRAADKATGRVFGSDDLIEDDEFGRSEMYVDFCRKLEFFYVVGAVVPLLDRGVPYPASTGSMMGIIGVHRPRQAGLFGASAKKELQLFLPHLQRALQIRQRLSAPSVAQQVAVEGLERTGTATLVVLRDSAVLYANRQAETLLSESAGIIARHGRTRDHEPCRYRAPQGTDRQCSRYRRGPRCIVGWRDGHRSRGPAASHGSHRPVSSSARRSRRCGACSSPFSSATRKGRHG